MKKASFGISVAVYALLTILVIAVLALTLPPLVHVTAPPPPLAKVPTPTATAIPPTPTPLPTIAAFVPGSGAPAAAAPAEATARPPAALLPVGRTTGWNLVFQDEFAGAALDRGKWTTCYPWFEPAKGCTSVGNDELQWYLPQQVQVANGQLDLSVQPQRYKGTDGQTYDYVSGMVASGAGPATGPGFAFQYGYAEARLKIPAGSGVCPAFWLNPANGSWPPEVDIAERVGNPDSNKIEMIVHYLLPQGGHDFNSTHFTGPDFSADWHVFGIEWTPNSLVWYIDGVERKRFTPVDRIPHTPMVILFTLAIRGDPGPDETVTFPATLAVDYVRVWQH